MALIDFNKYVSFSATTHVETVVCLSRKTTK